MINEEYFKRKYKSKIASTRGRVDKHGNPIEFKLSFEQYCKLWNDEGKLPCFPWCLSRKEDIGHYEIGNVYINTSGRNSLEAADGSADNLLCDFALVYGTTLTRVRRSLKAGTLSLEFIESYMKNIKLFQN